MKGFVPTFHFLFTFLFCLFVSFDIMFQVGLVIGKGGETIKSMQARTGARIQVYNLIRLY